MGFLYPQFLFAFGLLAVPIVIHLFNFRRYKKIFFTDISFLKEIKIQTKQRSRLRHLILLTLRLLAFSALVMAFAQPYNQSSSSTSQADHKVISIYVDNSFSMQALSENGPLLDLAIQRAGDIITQYDRNDLFQLVTNDFRGIEQRLYPREEMAELLKDIKPGPLTRTLKEVFHRIDEVQKDYPAAARRIVLLTDFQRSQVHPENITDTDAKTKIILVPLQRQKAANLCIDSVWFNSPVHNISGSEEITFRIRNYSDQDIENASVHVIINDASKAKTTFNVPAQSYIDSAVRFTNITPGIQRGSIVLDDNNLPFDNTFYFSYQVKANMRVLCLVSKSTTPDTSLYDVRNVFIQDAYYLLDTRYAENTDYSQLGKYDLVILNRIPSVSSGLILELQKYVGTGGSTLILPASGSELGAYGNLFNAFELRAPTGIDTITTRVGKINLDDIFFRNVFERKPERIDVPVVRRHWIYQSTNNTLETAVLTLENGRPMFSRFPYKKGKVFMSFVPTDERGGNFARHALFVPILLRSAEMSQGEWPASFVMGRDLSVEIRNRGYSGENVFAFSDRESGQRIIPASQFDGSTVRIFFPEQMRTAGNYDLLASGEKIFAAALNYNRVESDPRVLDGKELKTTFEKAGLNDIAVYTEGTHDVKLDLARIDNTSKIWKWMIWLVLLFVFTESLLIRLWKT